MNSTWSTVHPAGALAVAAAPTLVLTLVLCVGAVRVTVVPSGLAMEPKPGSEVVTPPIESVATAVTLIEPIADGVHRYSYGAVVSVLTVVPSILNATEPTVVPGRATTAAKSCCGPPTTPEKDSDGDGASSRTEGPSVPRMYSRRPVSRTTPPLSVTRAVRLCSPSASVTLPAYGAEASVAMIDPKSSNSTFDTERPGPADAAAVQLTDDAGAVVHAAGAVSRTFGLPIVSMRGADGPARPWASMATATRSRTAPFGNPEVASGIVLNCAVYGAVESEPTIS